MQRRTVVSIFALTAAVALGTLIAAAQGPGSMKSRMKGMPGMNMDHGMMGRDCPMMGMMMGGAGMPTFAEGRIAFLKAELAITPAQQIVWDGYAAALKKNLTGMRHDMTTAASGKGPVARVDAQLAAMEGHVAALKEMKPALAKLYDALSDEQKKKADQILTGMSCMM